MVACSCFLSRRLESTRPLTSSRSYHRSLRALSSCRVAGIHIKSCRNITTPGFYFGSPFTQFQLQGGRTTVAGITSLIYDTAPSSTCSQLQVGKVKCFRRAIDPFRTRIFGTSWKVGLKVPTGSRRYCCFSGEFAGWVPGTPLGLLDWLLGSGDCCLSPHPCLSLCVRYESFRLASMC